MSKTEDVTYYEVEKHVPVPESARAGKYPWHEMEDGDSILVPHSEGGKASRAARKWVKRRRPHFSVVTRTLEDGLRIWMVQMEDAPV